MLTHILVAIAAAIEAGKQIRMIYAESEDAEKLVVTYKDRDDPLTMADLIAHNVINEHLAVTGLPVLSEEHTGDATDERKSWKTFWLVDPLDGTKEFIKRNGEFTVNIALIHDHEPVMGVIYVPVSDTLYFAARGFGSYKLEQVSSRWQTCFMDDSDIHHLASLSQKLPVKNDQRPFTVVASRSHASEETDRFVQQCREKHPDLQCISKGSSLKICLVAEGVADVYPRLAPTMEWDTAAGQAIAENAGCRVTIYPGNEPLHYNKDDLRNPHFLVAVN